MKTKTFVVGYVLALALFLFAKHRTVNAQSISGFRTVVDLTRPMGGTARISRSQTTRIEAPAEAATGLWTVDQIPPQRLIAPLVVLDVRSNIGQNSGYQISMEDIDRWEQLNGQIPPGAVVIARTVRGPEDSSPKSFAKEISPDSRYSDDAAKFLVEGRQIFGLGVDRPTPLCADASKRGVCQYALAHSVYQLENVTNLDQIPSHDSVVIVAPEKVTGAAGTPARVMALLR